MKRVITILIIGLLSTIVAQGQIRIGGNVYGGGNNAEVKGSTKVTVKAGDIGAVLDTNAVRPLSDPQGKVFGGARMANVGGNTFVHIDGENATGYILINQVFGGNDISGKIGTAKTVGEDIPAELTAVKRLPADATDSTKNVVDNTFNSYVRISTLATNEHYTQEEITAASTDPEAAAYGKRTTDVKPDPNAKKIYIGQLFGGGNGDYTYLDEYGDSLRDGDDYIVKQGTKQGDIIIARSATPFVHPEQDSTYLEIKGGSIVYGYGGGNNATVKEQTLIHFDNPSAVVNHIWTDTTGVEVAKGTKGAIDLLSYERFKEMGINTTFSQPSSGAYQVGRFFGGNNKAEMSIRPTWNLLAGKIRNLYSGGNKGAMTSPEGLLLEIEEYSSLIVDNLYGGCRMADVKPTVNGEYSPCTNLPGYSFPNELSARTLVRGGYVHNVYGGNDVTGTVYGGNAVGIYTNVYGNVYGGGNGAYPYTDLISEDNETYGETYGDFHYNIPETGSSIDALNAFRPNAEQVSIRLKGTDARHQTIIHGSVFVGGNCASLDVKKKNPLIELKMGSYVVCDNVYLGNNGESMVDTAYLKRYADDNFSTLNLTNAKDFAEYMEGVAMTQQPRIVFDNVANGDPAPYKQYSSYVGSFFCGGNVGSMAIPGKMTFSIDSCLNIYNKFVGGCNNADIPAQEGLNAFYEGGILGSKDERGGEDGDEYYTDNGLETGNIKDRLEINFKNLAIMPLRWNDTFENVYIKNGNVATKLTKGKEYYHTNLRSTKFIADGTETADATHTYYELTTIGNALEWNTAKWSIPEDNFIKVENASVDSDTRLLEGNIYGGCYNSGHVNGNIIINIDEDILLKDDIFGTGTSTFLGHEKSGVDFEGQRNDVMAVALSVFGAGHGEKTEVWGSTTSNLNKGYTLQIFGGGEQGVVGKREHDAYGIPVIDEEDNYSYVYDSRYSTTVNLKGDVEVYSKDDKVENLAEAEYLYGGGNEGLVCGNTLVNLGKGRIYDAFGGASDADILGHAEVYIGRQPNGTGGYNDGFPWIKDIVYGGNDFGGKIHGGIDKDGKLVGYEDDYNFKKRVKSYSTDSTQLHGFKAGEIPEVLKSSTYVEYLQGRVDTIFGGGYGAYNYTNTALYGDDAAMPKQHSSFVNVRPKDHAQNALKAVFGGGTGYPGNRANDEAQDRSYVLIDIPDGDAKFKTLEAFGSGSYNGLGMREEKSVTFASGYDRDNISSIIDLLHGEISNVYGGSYHEGVTARTVVNVPDSSTIKMKNIFGGAYGTHILPPCDVIQAIVNYNNKSEMASVSKIYGGNNNERRSLFTQVNISSPVWSDKSKGYLATVYGAGHGIDTWSEHTLVNLNKGAKVYEVYGGGEMGHVLNAESVQRYMWLYKNGPSDQISTQDPYWKDSSKWTKDEETGMRTVKPEYKDRWDADWKDAWKLGSYYEPNPAYDNYFEAFAGLRNTSLVYKAGIDDRDFSAFSDTEKEKRQYIYSTNVIINDSAEVVNYAYGGGYGTSEVERSGDVYGHTYIALLGGTVKKDIYAAGTAGAVNDIFRVGAYNGDSDDENYNPYGFTASATAYIKGGTCRNVYGGGWEGNVGAHTGDISDSPASDVPAETHVVIGDLTGSSFTSGIPAVQRNVYGGGEGGAVFGTAYLTMNNGYVGYQYNSNGSDDSSTKDFDERYVEKVEDDTKTTPNTLLEEAGCVFGGGYIDNSTVDKTFVTINGGNIRNSVFGGGEIAAIGRGDMQEKTGGTDYELKGIYRPGKTNVKMYSGHVHRNVFGGGRGYDNLNRHGSLHSDGYIFGQTEVSIHGGEIGTVSGVADGDGNVFGGGDVGFVYSAYEYETTETVEGVPTKVTKYDGIGKKDGVRYDPLYQGYYYKYENGAYVTENIYYTAEEAAAYNTEHSLSEGDAGYKTTSDVKKTERQFTEDCKVLVEPQCKVVNRALDIDGKTFSVGQYVPIEKLNKLENKNTDKAKWDCLDQTGIIIHNAVFAGGNANAGSLTTGANTYTVFGNATASINDVYHRDLITLGTRHTGGLYGDGNLTLVDGYRELNITNYGTDYYSIAKEIDINTYHELPEREAAYYELNYTCLAKCTDKQGTIYNPAPEGQKATTITADDMLDLFLEKVGDTYVSIKNDASGNVSSNGQPVLVWDEGEHEWKPNTAAGTSFWKESGVLPVYAGRLMNSIQRADLCGVFGSRMVMQGAQDRVPEEVDYTNYTVNRVREVSLNKMDSKISSDLAIAENSDEYYMKHTHGNYFGIYNVVNYLGALTSDVRFTDVRKTDNTNDDPYQLPVDDKPYGTATFYDWKKGHIKDKTRNNGASHNKVALASGVYLEITTEESTGSDFYEKVWGPITGIIELDLINVSTGIGGGFVYAKNVHGIPSLSGAKNTTLTALNEEAVTQWDYTYDTRDDADHQKEWESSGNFVHSTQTIIDDCYNISNRYYGANKMPAHFWYIKGSTYVYDQYISAYTGQSNAFSEVVDIPLTIAAASHGKMKLLNVMPNRYAYYAKPGEPLGDDKKMIINGKTYYKNDPISYWDWYLLSNYEKDLFVQKTYVVKDSCYINSKYYAPGDVMLPDEYNTLSTIANANKLVLEEGEAAVAAVKRATKDSEGNPVVVTNDAGNDVYAAFDFIFHESNNVSHEEGYILTYEVNNPSQWDNWYTPKSNTTEGGKITLETYNAKDVAGKALYEDGPTYRLNTSDGAVLGQSEYKHGDLIPEDIYYTYEGKSGDPKYPGIKSHVTASNGTQATFVKAYIVKNMITVTEDGHETYYNTGTAVPATFATNPSYSSSCEEAYICTKSIELTKEKVIYKGSKMKKSEATGYVSDVNGKMNTIKAGASDMTIEAIKALATTGEGAITVEKKKELISLATLRDDLKNCLVQAYYCTSKDPSEQGYDGPYYYGGNYYESGHNYRALEAWSSMSETDREMFDFNYDALDLLIDKDYTTAASGAKSEGQKYQYDSAAGTLAGAQANAAHYSLETSVDYTAEYNDEDDLNLGLGNTVTFKRGNETKTDSIIKKGDELSRKVFEDSLINEVRHYTAVAVKNATLDTEGSGKYLVYVVNTPFQVGSTPYAVGETISSATYASLSGTEQGYVTTFKFTAEDNSSEAVYYYCRESYTEDTEITPISDSTIPGAGGGISNDGKVQVGTLIYKSNYDNLKNQQNNFTIHGASPTETSTLYVSRESNIYDLSKEKIITVIYQYDYDETDTQGNVTPISERHVLNIHLTFKSGVPTIEDITPPEIILPGDRVSLRKPTVTPGAYEVTGSGWEIFATQRDAESHTNGVEYNPDFNQLYWYQDNYYVAYYAKSYLGRTYSNAVPVSVANYHDLKKVMDDADHHYYIDHKNVQRDSKIYINDYSKSGQNGLDLFKNLYDLSLLTTPAASGALAGHAVLNSKVKGGKDLEFFMRTDIDHSSSSWTPIGSEDDPSTTEVNEEQCFEGNLHGDGHTISGLDNSLFKNLCGNVYNLGVTGSFNTAGVVDMGTGYVESAWVKTSATTPLETKPNAVFGRPTDTGYQLVNSYFWNGNKKLYGNIAGDTPAVPDYEETITSGGDRGKATAKSDTAFYNGELAYDLNNFYLYKRYNDHETTTGTEKQNYSYFTIGDNDELVLQNNHYYSAHADLCSTGHEYNSNVIKYVEDRFADGDYRFAAGVIPEDEDERCHEETVTEGGVPTTKIDFYPIWPDDYIFFGQKLTYGWAAEAHQNVPTAVARDGGRLSTGDDANRVYRAPAYYRSKVMGMTHFNPAAYFAQKEKLSDEQIEANEKAKEESRPEDVVTPRDAYPNMTAIDFKGHYDGNNGAYAAYGTYGLGNQTGLFYTPLLDDDGLLSIQNCDETQNIVVYAPAEDANAKTYTVLNSYFTEPDYSEHYDNSKGYRLVSEASAASVHGHLVQSDKKTTYDHLLVDYQDFNAPIAYTLGAEKRMWYQRLPYDKEYVDLTKGWQGISIPFSAELVTTNQKGEITHFYSGSKAIEGSKAKIGHEYWLREFNKDGSVEGSVYKANFKYPNASGDNKNVTNTFLWDYYYENTAVHNQKDKNADKYQQYYSDSRTYNNYPLLTKARPYLLGLPGATYYEFDLSGNFEAKNTAESITKLGKQIITFASNKAEHIGVSDDEMAGVLYDYDGYTFKPTYMNNLKIESGKHAFLLNSTGNSYVETTAEEPSVVAFRPYFIANASAGSRVTRSIIFSSNEDSEMPHEESDSYDKDDTGRISVMTSRLKIDVKSTLKETVNVRILTLSGLTISTFELEPGQTVETRLSNAGVYIVQTLDGKMLKKLTVR